MPDYVRRLRGIVGADHLLQLPSVSVALRDSHGRVLLARHVEGDLWVLPGGTVEPGETPADAAVREMWEETGLHVSLTHLVGVFGGHDYIVRYRNGHRTSYVMTVFEAAAADAAAQPDGSELLETRFVSERDAASLRAAAWLPEVLHALFRGDRVSAFRAATWTPHERRP